jgi:DNA-binding transcriptional MerR regulator
MDTPLPVIPAKRYFTIGEVGDLCGVKPHVLRYWEQEFSQLRPMKRRGNRRYYQHHEVLMIRRIRELLYDQGFTISGARNKLQEQQALERDRKRTEDTDANDSSLTVDALAATMTSETAASTGYTSREVMSWQAVRNELSEIRHLLDHSEFH